MSLLSGIDHIYLSVSDMRASEAFYDRVMEALGLHKGDKQIAGERHAHYLAPTFQLTIRPARGNALHDPYSPGLHHLCFQAKNNEDVDACYEKLKSLGLSPTEPQTYPEYHEEYYATFFDDPDGIRLEIVARTSYRDAIDAHFDNFQTFLNPLASLKNPDAGG